VIGSSEYCCPYTVPKTLTESEVNYGQFYFLRNFVLEKCFHSFVELFTFFMSQKKCPSCQQWSNWSQKLDDKCEHCGALLEGQRIAEIRQREKMVSRPMTFNKRKIEPGDSLGKAIYKRVFNVTGAAYFAFLSFMVWLIAVAIH
jgi:hypothetical protein